ncbi:hypothetical protein GQ600_25674 [Phytophthora cactorum]|nr:hypothetical protein GQ600_25674 [Phytophthora cactorum]
MLDSGWESAYLAGSEPSDNGGVLYLCDSRSRATPAPFDFSTSRLRSRNGDARFVTKPRFPTNVTFPSKRKRRSVGNIRSTRPSGRSGQNLVVSTKLLLGEVTYEPLHLAQR